MSVSVIYENNCTIVYENVMEIINVPNTMNIVIKCGFPHWETKVLIRNDIKKMEVMI